MTTAAIRCPRDPLFRGDAVQLGHLDVEDHEVRPKRLRELDGALPVAGLPYDVVLLLSEHLGEVEPDERLVLGDDDPPSVGCFLCVHAPQANRRS